MDKNVKTVVVSTGHIGVALAVAISWSINKSILWGILHGMCGWFYVIYYGFGGGQ